MNDVNLFMVFHNNCKQLIIKEQSWMSMCVNYRRSKLLATKIILHENAIIQYRANRMKVQHLNTD